jgi:hypothetical protein
MVVVIAPCTKDTGNVADTVIGDMNDSEQEEQPPVNFSAMQVHSICSLFVMLIVAEALDSCLSDMISLANSL